LRGDEVAHAPWLAATATPWPGAVQAWASVEVDGGFAPNRVLPVRAVMGVTLDPLDAARPGVWDRGPGLRLRLKGGVLKSVSDAALMSGANLVAIGDGRPDGWELVQFADARLVAPGVWEVSRRLRGQAGTDAFMPEVWPAGSIVVMMNGAPKQVDLPPDARGQMRYWRIGPASRPPEDASYRQLDHAFAGAGLRPLSPVHLTVEGRRLSWVRRTRVSGDGWDGPDVPLGESAERYVVRLMRKGVRLHERIVGAPACEIAADAWDAAAAGGSFAIEVAQLSDIYGPGPFARRIVNV
ncbi:MAG TPA: host specificity protein, partial [Paracoccus sp. (in: a-proteobacteria)]|nr:host specificity protein [Paracoccus sp. (in: a-proteobacteria)]